MLTVAQRKGLLLPICKACQYRKPDGCGRLKQCERAGLTEKFFQRKCLKGQRWTMGIASDLILQSDSDHKEIYLALVAFAEPYLHAGPVLCMDPMLAWALRQQGCAVDEQRTGSYAVGIFIGGDKAFARCDRRVWCAPNACSWWELSRIVNGERPRGGIVMDDTAGALRVEVISLAQQPPDRDRLRRHFGKYQYRGDFFVVLQ